MKLIAIEITFIFILSLVAAIVFLIFFTNLKNIIIDFFYEKQPKEDFELEKIVKNNFSENFLIELANLCAERANKSKLNIQFFTCFYLLSEQKFENIKINDYININDIRISFTYLNKSKNNALVIYNREKKEVLFLN